ncbi:Hdd1 protein [Danaus plexippus plexippus]|uniref:Hdd1 protein n=1 Tax=Danaus plexippus plexippus TaxID=278856 RepID=A0A212F8D0_DANPL|nr:Hdd1 protein [Danaus plexippus plexippus]
MQFTPIISDIVPSLQYGDITMTGDLPIGGMIKVCGCFPVYGMVNVDGSLPSAGTAIVAESFGNQVIEIVNNCAHQVIEYGEAAILTGGIGAKSVTIELKSPSILRGYRFEVEVFSNNPNLRLQSKGYSAPLYDGQYARKF